MFSSLEPKAHGRANILRIYHEYEGRIEKSVRRITFWHHEVCQVMTNGDLEGWIFLSYPRFFFLLTTFFFSSAEPKAHG